MIILIVLYNKFNTSNTISPQMAVHGGSLITLDVKEDLVITPTVTRPYSLNGRNESEAVKSVRADREEDIKKSVESGDVRGRGEVQCAACTRTHTQPWVNIRRRRRRLMRWLWYRAWGRSRRRLALVPLATLFSVRPTLWEYERRTAANDRSGTSVLLLLRRWYTGNK